MAYFDKFGVEFTDDRKTLVRCPEDFKGEYIIPDGVISIGDFAFASCTDLTSINIPNNVTKIGYRAFSWCKRLTAITIPDSVSNIGSFAFNGCTGLTSITIPYSITSIGDGTFHECSNLKSIMIPSSVTKIGDVAFAWCKGLTSISIPNSVTNIGEGAFFRCYGLTSVTIPDSVKWIGKDAFSNCIGLTFINIPNSVTCIGTGAFSSCYSVTSVTIPDNVKWIGENAFHGCGGLNPTVRRLMEERKCDAKSIVEEQEKIQWNKTREAGDQRLIEIQQRQEMLYGSTMFFDTETTGILSGFNSKRPVTDSYNWPRLVQLAWIMTDDDGKVLKQKSHIIIPEGFWILDDAVAVHHITTERARKEGELLRVVLDEFVSDLELAERVVCHNIDYDKGVVSAELYRQGMDYDALMNKLSICTMKSSTDYCAITKKNSIGYKWPSLQELYQKLFGRSFEDAHDALSDVTATKDCYFELKRRGIIKE